MHKKAEKIEQKRSLVKMSAQAVPYDNEGDDKNAIDVHVSREEKSEADV